MIRKFRDIKLSRRNVERLNEINDIINEYSEQGYKLTLRQLYYQLVSRDIIDNKVSEYAKLSKLLTEGRMGGIVDWFAIEDRLRKPYIEYSVSGVQEAIDDTIEQYKLNRQSGQDVYVELWVEKDALSGVLRPITDKYHIKLMVNRGYSSTTAMYDAYRRLMKFQREYKKTIILYLGDHDPSGLDMIRDIGTRLNEFGVYPEVRQIGLTMEQIKKFNPPPNPAKVTDPRAKKYIEEHGRTSWEVDALNPETLNKLVRENVEKEIHMGKYYDMIDREEEDKTELQKLNNIYESSRDN